MMSPELPIASFACSVMASMTGWPLFGMLNTRCQLTNIN